jgi:hypothetical protein
MVFCVKIEEKPYISKELIVNKVYKKERGLLTIFNIFVFKDMFI